MVRGREPTLGLRAAEIAQVAQEIPIGVQLARHTQPSHRTEHGVTRLKRCGKWCEFEQTRYGPDLEGSNLYAIVYIETRMSQIHT